MIKSCFGSHHWTSPHSKTIISEDGALTLIVVVGLKCLFMLERYTKSDIILSRDRKTVFACAIIEHLQQKSEGVDAGVAYICCAYNERHTVSDLVACLPLGYLLKDLSDTCRFLHARSHASYLATKHNVRSFREALRDLPKSSGAIYQEAMGKLKSQNPEAVRLAEKMLLWIVNASRPLRVKELQHLLAVREGDLNIDDNALTAPTYILSICAGLVTIDERGSICRLVHYTVQEFLRENRARYFPWGHVGMASIFRLQYPSFDSFGAGPCPSFDKLRRRRKFYVLFDSLQKTSASICSGVHHRRMVDLALRPFQNKRYSG